MGWKRSMSGYTDGCTQAHIDDKTVARMGWEAVHDLSFEDQNETVAWLPASYIVTNIEDSPTVDER